MKHLPGLSQLDEPSRDVPRHDDQWVLQLTVCFGCQFAVNKLTSSDDFLTHSILQNKQYAAITFHINTHFM